MFIRQSAEGRWLFQNRNTPEVHEPVYFNLEYLLIGKTASFLGMSIEAAFNLWRLLGSLAMLWGFFLLTGIYFSEFWQRAWLLIFFSLGNGFGWLNILISLLSGQKTISLPMDITSETQPFNQMLFTPHSTWAAALNILAMFWFLQGIRTQKSQNFWRAGGAVFLIGLFRPYGLVFFGGLVITWAIIRLLKKQLDKNELLNYCRCLTLPLLALVYNGYIFKFHPVFRWWGLQSFVQTPGLLVLCWSLGLPLLLAVGAIVNRDFRKPVLVEDQIIYLWVGFNFLLIYCYHFFRFANQLSTLLTPPLYLLAGWLLFQRENYSTYRRPLATVISSPRIRVVIFALLLVFASSGSWMLLAKINQIALAGNAYLDKEWLMASRWIEENTPQGGKVIAAYYSANFLPHYTGRTVFAGYNYNTVDFDNKLKMLQKFLSWTDPEYNRKLLRRWQIDYVWEDSYISEGLGASAKRASFLEKVYHNGKVTIYKVL